MTTRSPIVIGVAVPDLSAFTALDSTFGVGDQREQVEAVFQSWRADGRLPVAGRDVRPVFRTFGATDTAEKRAAASAFADDDVVAVIGARDFTYGAVRVAERGVPVVDVNAVPTSLFRRTAPYLFTLRAAQDVLYRSFIRWAHREQFLAGRRIGVFCDRFTRESTDAAQDELAELDSRVRVRIDSDGAGVGSDLDTVAAARFRDEGVDVLLPFVSGSSLIRLLASAAEIGYQPTVVDLETGEHATDVTARLMPRAIYDGTYALTMNRVGELAAGRTLESTTATALADFERHTGRPVDPLDAACAGEVTNILIARDVTTLVLEAIRIAGEEITRSSVARALTSLRDVPMASGGNVTFTEHERWGIRQVRTIQWRADAGHWVVRSEFEDLPLPQPERVGR